MEMPQEFVEQKKGDENLSSEDAFVLEAKRARSSARIYYEAQVEVIRSQIGELESIRSKLGLSQRKIAQLLLVDPSSWTRWTRHGDTVPPHIYRALQWYMILVDKIPGLTPQYFIGRDSNVLKQEFSKETQELRIANENLQKKLADLEMHVKYNRVGFMMMALGTTILAVALYWRWVH